MNKITVNIEWAGDGTISAYMIEESFSGMGNTVDQAIEDMKSGVEFYIRTAKEMGFPYKDYLDGDYEIALHYDVPSILRYAANYMTYDGISKLTGINPIQIARYAAGKTKPRMFQETKILKGLQKFSSTFCAISL